MKAVFLDRDGTLIVDPPDLRVDSIDEIELFPDTLKALSELAKLDFGVFIVSNQAGIGEGRITKQEFITIEDKVIDLIGASGIKILKTYICPHKSSDNCVCRKPKPYMILRAAQEFNIDLPASYFIGDSESDILAGVDAGTKNILVKTGNEPVTSPEATYTADHLMDAIEYIARDAKA